MELQTFARANGLGRISLWSANRDRPCPSGAVGFVAGNCSGIAQAPNAFSAVFGRNGGTPAATTIPTTTSQPAPTTTPAGVTAWSPSTPYPGGSQVSRNGAIYRAKWWNVGFAPDTPVAQTWDTPPTTVPPTTTTTSPSGPAPARPEVAYWAGTRVLQAGGVYEAKWWSQGFAPDTPVAFPWDSPWKRVT